MSELELIAGGRVRERVPVYISACDPLSRDGLANQLRGQQAADRVRLALREIDDRVGPDAGIAHEVAERGILEPRHDWRRHNLRKNYSRSG